MGYRGRRLGKRGSDGCPMSGAPASATRRAAAHPGASRAPATGRPSPTAVRRPDRERSRGARPMADARYFFAAAQEQFPPGDLLEQAVAAERAGFDAIACSDHFQPWWEPGESGHAWVWLGAAAQATERVPVGTAVTPPVWRHHPAIVA